MKEHINEIERPMPGLVLPLAIIQHSGTDRAVSIRDQGGHGEWVASCDANKAEAVIRFCNSHASLVEQRDRLLVELAEAKRSSFQDGRISYRGFNYGVGSQWGIDSLRSAIKENGHG